MVWFTRGCYRDLPILYVDDSRENLETFASDFSKEFDILTALGKNMGLMMLKEHSKVAVVIAGHGISPGSGLEFLRSIRRRFPSKIVVLVTEGAQLDDIVDAVNSGEIYKHVNEPWDLERITIILKRGIEFYQLAGERDLLIKENKENIENMARTNKLSDVGIMAASLAHEVNNPLLSINAFFDMLPDRLQDLKDGKIGWEDPFWTSYREIVKGEVQRIGELISELVEFSQISRPVSERCDINEIVESMLMLVGHNLDTNKISVVKDLTSGLPEMCASKGKIKQVVLNLLLNASESLREGGMIEVATRAFHHSEKGEMVELRIKDNGKGISEENLKTIFTPFFTTKSEGRGKGLGLAICKDIAEYHSGQITVESKSGEGTIFIVTFPIQPGI